MGGRPAPAPIVGYPTGYPAATAAVPMPHLALCPWRDRIALIRVSPMCARGNACVSGR
jgi:hypothetical protein